MLIQVPFYKGQEYGYQYKNVYEKLPNFERFEGNSDVICPTKNIIGTENNSSYY